MRPTGQILKHRTLDDVLAALSVEKIVIGAEDPSAQDRGA